MKKSALIVVAAVIALAGCGGTRSDGTPPDPPEISLQEAVLMGNARAIRDHIAAGSDLDAKDEYGSSPLIVAATFGATDSAITLIEAGADVNQSNNEGSSPLHIAAFLCHTEIVRALLDAGADVNAVNNAGHTARQSLEAPFAAVKPIYDSLAADLGPLGLRLDYEHLEQTRPKIAGLLDK